MNRRDAISRVALIMGGTMVGMDYLLSGCKHTSTNVKVLFNPDRVQFLDEVGDTILPATKTPGAKEVHIGSFMAQMVNDCYVADDQQIFIDGMAKLNERCQHSYGKQFLDCSPKQRTAFLTILDKEQRNYTKTKGKDEPNHYFKMMKELTLLGYFTSEDGCTKALRYEPVPGKFDGCIPYKKGDKAWAID
jgi:hypothetical protein